MATKASTSSSQQILETPEGQRREAEETIQCTTEKRDRRSEFTNHLPYWEVRLFRACGVQYSRI